MIIDFGGEVLEKIYNAETVDECLKKASNELKINIESINYKIIEEKKNLFRKSASISVEFTEQVVKPEDEVKVHGEAAVKAGKLVITNPKEGGRPAVLAPGFGINLFVKDEKVKVKAEVYEESEINYHFDETTAVRNLHIEINQDKMEAYISINYEPEIIYGLEDKESSRELLLEAKVVEKKYPPQYTKDEILQELSKKGIVYGIIAENVELCTGEKGIKRTLIAKGKPVINDEPDKVEYKFKINERDKEYIEDSQGRVDYKSIGAVEAVNAGDIIAILHPGSQGMDGMDIFGVVRKHKIAKRISLRTDSGCSMKDENTVVADIAGKPGVKGLVFSIYPLHQIPRDIDLTTGNIDFIGDICVQGSIREGMRVIAGNSLEIMGNMERAEAKSSGNLSVKGNIISSKLSAGGEDSNKLTQVQNLTAMEELLGELIKAVEEIKKFNILGYNVTDGEIVKKLLETKFKMHNVLYKKIVLTAAQIPYTAEDEKILRMIKCKITGLGPLTIKHYGELETIQEMLQRRRDELNDGISLPVNINIMYCQDSHVTSSGNIYVDGKGALVSTLVAQDSIYFTQGRSVTRGGILTAQKEIHCQVVGSDAGVSTRLCVKAKGHIYCEIAYQNTVFVIGTKEYVLEMPSKGIHVYINNDNELIADKLLL